MTDEQTDYSQVYDFLYRIGKRITYLEKDATFIEKKIIALEEKKSREYNSMTEDLKLLHSDISSLKNSFLQCAHGMTRLSRNLKDSVQKDNILTLNTQVEEIKFEEYVTAQDLKRGL